MLIDLIQDGFRLYPIQDTIFYGKIGIRDVVSFKFKKLRVVAFQKLHVIAVKDAESKKFL